MSKDSVSQTPENAPTNDAKSSEATIEEHVEQGKRAFALKQFDKAVEQYAMALELTTAKFGDKSLESADLLLPYGKALLENAVSQSAVLSKEEEEKKANEAEEASEPKDPRFLFEGDGPVEDDEDEPVELSNLPDDEHEEDGEDQEEEGDGGEDEPEDDFNAAWEVLELARVLYDQHQDEDDEIKLKLADTYLALGDVSLETEKFEQAIDDYASAMKLKVELLPGSSRQVAEGHLKLALVLDITSGRLAEAIEHVQKSIESVEQRLSELRVRDQAPPAASSSNENGNAAAPDKKGKGKAKKLIRDPLPSTMTPTQIEAEIKELEEMKQELLLKLEDIKAGPDDGSISGAVTTAPELAAAALDKELSTSAISAAAKAALANANVNDLTAVVKKKKKTESASSSLKRKAGEVESSEDLVDKRAKVEDEKE